MTTEPKPSTAHHTATRVDVLAAAMFATRRISIVDTHQDRVDHLNLCEARARAIIDAQDAARGETK